MFIFKTLSTNKFFLFLASLLFIDILFIGLHGISSLTIYIQSQKFHLDIEGSYAEFFQYIKWAFIATLFVFFAYQKKYLGYFVGAFLFLYFLFDDSLGLHEAFGTQVFTPRFSELSPPFGLRVQDVGELICSILVLSVFLPLSIFVYYKGTKQFKNLCCDMIFLLALFAFFGVFFDMLHAMIHLGWKVDFFMGLIEEAGEMAVASFMLGYLFFVICNPNFIHNKSIIQSMYEFVMTFHPKSTIRNTG